MHVWSRALFELDSLTMVCGFERLDSRDGYLALPASRPCVNHGESIEMKSKVGKARPPTHARVQRLDSTQDTYVFRRLFGQGRSRGGK